MSNVGQGVLIVAGTIIGAYFGSPQLGFVLGSLAGNALFPTQLPGQSGPRLTDNQTTSSVVGSPVSILFGTASLSGTFMWLAPIVETTNTQHVGGKGGPTQTNTTYTYTQSVAVGLCEGPIGGLLRVWENGMLVYDIRVQQAGESDTDYANRLTVAAVYAETFTLHLGDDTQVADATIESIEGMGNVPGFRGLAYIVYPDRKLQETQALRHPSFKFEVFNGGVGACVDSSEYSNEVLFKWEAPGSLDPRHPRGTFTYQFSPSMGGSPGPVRSTLEAAIADGSLRSDLYGWSPSGGAGGPYSPWLAIPSFVGNELQVSMFFNTLAPGSMTTAPLAFPANACDLTHANPNVYWTGAYYSSPTTLAFSNHGVFSLVGPGLGNIGSCPGYGMDLECKLDDQINVIRAAGAPSDPCFGLPAAPIIGYCIRGDGKYVRGGDWTLDNSRSYKVLAATLLNTGVGIDVVTQYPANPCLPPGSPDDNPTFWTAAYNAAVTAGDVPSGWTYGVDYPFTQGFAWTVDMRVCEAAGGGVSLGTIIRAICLRCGLTDVDATDMDTVFVDGYAVSSVSAGRDILTPLRSVGFFDCVESGGTLKFVARGKAIVASLEQDDFGAYDGSATGGTPGPSITTVKAQDPDLPLQTRVHYFATSRDYEAGEQLSPTRLTTTAVNVVDVELAVCMNDTQAAKIADVIWSDAWAERWSGTLAVDQAQSQLEPGDCIEVPVDGVTRRIRIVNETIASGVLRTLNYVRDDDGAYVSHAVAAVPNRVPQKLKLLSATDLELLDLPALLDSDNDAGIYAAARGSALAGNAWTGCVIFRSADGGATFAQLASITTPSTIGALTTGVTPSDWHTWDDITTITVDVPAGVTFESRTDAAVLTGANSAAMGANGRWEIVQFANATQLTSTQWRLSRLLRGRRGTEHNISSSAAGDKFVMVSTGGLARLPLQTSEIGASRIYKAVTIGASYASGIDQPFAGQGVALRPFSPVLLTAERDTAGDITFHWTRRSRLGRTLMSGVDIPLGEASEAFQVDIYAQDSPHTVVRTLAVTTTTAVYTAAQQSTDFGSHAEGHVMVAVYQMSALVGRGTPDFQLLTIS